MSVLYEIGDSDFLQNVVIKTGVSLVWTPLTRSENYSHSTRIRAFRRDIEAAYEAIEKEQKGIFLQIIVKAMLKRDKDDSIRLKLIDALGDIGWIISDEGVVKTKDSLISEQFFPLNSEYDAYISIREVFSRAAADLTIVDAYLGSSLLQTLKSLVEQDLEIKVLTVESNLKKDFSTELTAFRKQYKKIKIEIKTTTDFHDRFIVVDGKEFYHVGASIKDAGRRAFMISRVQDTQNIDAIRQSINGAWGAGTLLKL